MSTGAVTVLLSNGDVSSCDGVEWVSINNEGKRVAKPLFGFPLTNFEDPLYKLCFEGVALTVDEGNGGLNLV
jgi:hypothetical protein